MILSKLLAVNLFKGPRIVFKWTETLKHCANFCSIKRKDNWESVIGLEVHAQIRSNSKLFSLAGTSQDYSVNSQVSLFDAAMPGSLPVLSRTVVEATILTAISLNCQINALSYFDRKHYFYSDMPAGYQITQKRSPIGKNGKLTFIVDVPGKNQQPYYKTARISQIQIEQDSGKSLHDEIEKLSLIDLNRAGIPLMEIVFEPDLKDGEEAAALIKELILILKDLGTCKCKMEEGSLRVDANVSVNKKGQKLGTRTEIKNISSVRSISNAIEYEVERQIELLNKGGKVVNETRCYDPIKKRTYAMRDKEAVQDYRFLPEPNIPPIQIVVRNNKVSLTPNTFNIVKIAKKVKPHPKANREGLMQKFHISLEAAIVILGIPGLLDYFANVMMHLETDLGKKAISLLRNELLAGLNERSMGFEKCLIEPRKIALLVSLETDGVITRSTSAKLVNLLLEDPSLMPNQVIDQKGWRKISDDEIIRETCLKILQENSVIVNKYLSTKKSKLIKKLIAIIDNETNSSFDMKKVSYFVNSHLKHLTDPSFKDDVEK